MTKALSAALVLMLPLLLTLGAWAAEGPVTEVIVTGRQPGPPLWKVSNGENVLWILPIVSVLPSDLDWDDTRVKRVIEEADEAIGMPDVDVDISKLVLLNPVNWFRGIRLAKRLSRNPDERTLRDVLPAATWQRYTALKATHFPREDDIDELRPVFATGRIREEVLKSAGLTRSGDIRKHVGRLIRRDRDIRFTEVLIEQKLEGGYRELSKRAEQLAVSMPAESEISCFESQLTMFERHLDDMKEVASAWASGNARDIEDYSAISSLDDPCAALLMASSEGAFMQQLLTESTERWLEAATEALNSNRSTFAMLSMSNLVGEFSLVDQLAARGYTLQIPR